jgi:O-antigen/teichoic acid export membrane protein
MFVAKLCPVEEMGRYALAVACVTPVMLAARMQLRYVLAADVESRLPFSVAAVVRAAALGAAVVAIAGVSLFGGSATTAWTVILVALVRVAEDAGELVLGVAQSAGEWRAITRSLVLHGLGGAAVIGLSLASSHRLILALAAALLWQAAVSSFHDWPAVRGHCGALAWPGWPPVAAAVRDHAALGGAAALVSLNAYIPRYAVERSLGLEAVGVFTALAQLALVGNIVVQAIGQAAVAPLSRAYARGPRPFLRALAGLVAFAALSGAAGLAGAAAGGSHALALLYRPAYASYGAELAWLAAAAAFTYLTAVLGYALVAAGERRAQLPIFAISAAVALAASAAATPVWGLRGAAWALLASWVAAATGTALALARRLAPWRRPAASPKLNEWGQSESARPGAARSLA